MLRLTATWFLVGFAVVSFAGGFVLPAIVCGLAAYYVSDETYTDDDSAE